MIKGGIEPYLFFGICDFIGVSMCIKIGM
uniref:Uncharacterized protein n=1 Tax=Tetranychus urticae TaxID=32264 RepID=T1JPZ8_TETUR